MTNNNQDSLRAQIIDSMDTYRAKRFDNEKCHSITTGDMFDHAIMPVLDAAMKAGELLVHRATTPQKPTSQIVVDWLDNTCESIARVRQEEATLSKRMLLNVLYIIQENALKALADARAEKGLQPDTGMPVPGFTIPKETKL